MLMQSGSSPFLLPPASCGAKSNVVSASPAESPAPTRLIYANDTITDNALEPGTKGITRHFHQAVPKGRSKSSTRVELVVYTACRPRRPYTRARGADFTGGIGEHSPGFHDRLRRDSRLSREYQYFKDSIGFKSLFLAIRDLVSDKRTIDVTLGFLLSMTLNDFALSGLFTTLRSLSMDQVDAKIHEFETRLIIIRQPDAIRLLWDSAPRLVDGSPVMRYAIYKLFELLCASCHRNHATLSTMGLVQSLLSEYFITACQGGYEILTDILRSKAQMINMTSFETLFESIGLNFRTPEQSTVVNVVLYKAIALDFEFWSHARREIQHVYFEHFITLLEVQVQGFQHEAAFIKAGLANFSKEDTIKPTAPHIAANIYEGSSLRLPKAEQVLEIFVSLLSNLNFYNKFITALPVMRICLLLIGDRPQQFVATQVLRIIAISIRISVSFKRKFGLISGWSVLKTALPECWDSAVNEAAFDVLLGRTPKSGKSRMDSENAVICPQIVPTILSALQTGLRSVVDNCGVSDEGGDGTFLLSSLHIDAPHFSRVAETTMERLVEDLLDLHASSATFKQIFRSQQTRLETSTSQIRV
ncbi:hypothetical protein BDZ89DRAFT_1261670 [Hymenopellis radicata]|nr:hypothetical protein BDZ89DRAFT_1261670 [Hymenopellis radicata]